MLSAWVPDTRPNGAPCMTYGRTIGKALDKFCIDRETWPLLASDRGAWRATLKTGLAPTDFRPGAQPPSPRIARNKPARACVRATIAAIEDTLNREQQML